MLSLAAASALSILLPDWQASTHPFDPAGDVETIATCRLVYSRLELTSARLRDRQLRTAGVVQAFRGGRRIAPFVDQAGTNAVDALVVRDDGSSVIRVILFQLVGGAQMDAPEIDPHITAARIYREIAGRCDRQLTQWGAPPSEAMPQDVAQSGFAAFRANDKTAADTFEDPATAALAQAACDGSPDAVVAAVAAGGRPNAAGHRGVTPLAWAIVCENLPGIAALLDAGANPNQPIGESGTPVLLATGYRNPEILRLLLRRGGDPNAVNDRDSALSIAFTMGMHRAGWTNFDSLLAAGADINRRFAMNQTIVDYAAMFLQYEQVLMLLQRGYSGDLVDLGSQLTSDEARTDLTAEAQRHIARVKAVLQERGVRFPVPRLAELERDARGFYVQP